MSIERIKEITNRKSSIYNRGSRPSRLRLAEDFRRKSQIVNNQSSIAGAAQVGTALRWTFAVNHNSQAGFTIIEVGIAIFILAIGLIGLLTLFPIGIDSTRRVTQDTNAAILSELAISDLKANDIVDIVGTMTAGQAYTYPDLDDPNQDKQFEDSSVNRVSARYSWQAVAKSINTTDTNLVRTQVVIFTYPPQFGTGTADFTQYSTSVQNISTLPSGITSKHYIRADTGSDKFWYRIDDIPDSSTITLEGRFLGTTGVDLQFSTTDDIIDIYETMFAKH